MPPFADRLLAWYRDHRRDLPWRRTPSAWRTWVSEVMLQQTRVVAVRAAFERFVRSYPDPDSLAAASDDELLAAWRGLGYYRRARLLREGARAVVAEHGGAVPGDLSALRALPGVGDYTAAAIASIAFDLPAPAVDGNVERVMARHAGIDEVVKAGAGRRRVREALAQRFPSQRAGDFNQALMDLGATVCTPRSPRCDACPVAADCAARANGTAAELPRLPPRRAAVDVAARAAVLADAGRLLARRVPQGEVNAGQLDLPGPGPLVAQDDAEDLRRWLEGVLACAVEVARDPVCAVRHGITHHRIRLHVHAARTRGAPRLPDGWAWLAADDARAPWTTLARKAFAAGAADRYRGAP